MTVHEYKLSRFYSDIRFCIPYTAYGIRYTVFDGGGRVNLQEPSGPVTTEAYNQSWEREYLDLTELARLRWVERWKLERLAEHFGVSLTAIKERLRAIKANPERVSIQIPNKSVRGK